jgi:hypothetical protein
MYVRDLVAKSLGLRNSFSSSSSAGNRGVLTSGIPCKSIWLIISSNVFTKFNPEGVIYWLCLIGFFFRILPGLQLFRCIASLPSKNLRSQVGQSSYMTLSYVNDYDLRVPTMFSF